MLAPLICLMVIFNSWVQVAFILFFLFSCLHWRKSALVSCKSCSEIKWTWSFDIFFGNIHFLFQPDYVILHIVMIDLLDHVVLFWFAVTGSEVNSWPWPWSFDVFGCWPCFWLGASFLAEKSLCLILSTPVFCAR